METARGPGSDSSDVDEAAVSVGRVPPLAFVAVGAAVFELALGRAIWHGLNEVLPAPALIELHQLARFPRNLSAVAGVVAVVVALFAFLRLPGFASIGRRLAVAAFAGVFVPSIVVAALLPIAMVQPKLVVFGLAAANVLVTLLGLTAARYRAERPLRIAVALASLASFVTLLVVGLGQLSQAQGGFWGAVGAVLVDESGGSQRMLMAIRHLGELAWIGVLVAGCVAAAWDRGAPRLRARVAVTVGLSVLGTVALLLLQDAAGHRFRYLLFGSFRLGLLVDDLPAAYTVPLAVGIAGACVAIARRDRAMQQLGAGMLAWLCAGFAPHTPIQLLYLVLGAVLLCRSAQARDRTSGWSASQPWARLTGAVTRGAPPARDVPGDVTHETFDDLGGRSAE